MQRTAFAERLHGPWAVLPDRMLFIRAALTASFARRKMLPQAPTSVVANVNRREVSNGSVAVLPLYGICTQRTDVLGKALGLVSLWHFTQALRMALVDDAVSGILIDVDSAGGSVYGVAELADEIYRSRARKPIFSVANSLAASGAYWIASAASEFYVTLGGEVGGIGIHDMHVDLSKGLEKAGIGMTLIAAGKFKTEGNPFQPLGADAREAMQKRVDRYFRAFVTAVAKHRGVPESAVRNGMGEGRLLGAERAKGENMVDGIATFDDVVVRFRQRVSRVKATNASHVDATRQLEIDALASRRSCRSPVQW